MSSNPNVTLHMVSSLDGCIAREDGDYSWLDSEPDAYAAGVADDSPEVRSVLATIDGYVIGSRTYETALRLGWPYGEKPVVVVSSRAWSEGRSTVEFYSGDLERLVAEVLAPRFREVWLAGGARLCRDFLRLDLVDRMVLTIAPVVVGKGLRLFGERGPTRRWRLTDVVAFGSGFVEMTYEARRGRS